MHELTIFCMVQFFERFGSMSANTRKPLANNLFDINTNTSMFDVQQLFKHIPIKYLICAYYGCPSGTLLTVFTSIIRNRTESGHVREQKPGENKHWIHSVALLFSTALEHVCIGVLKQSTKSRNRSCRRVRSVCKYLTFISMQRFYFYYFALNVCYKCTCELCGIHSVRIVSLKKMCDVHCTQLKIFEWKRKRKNFQLNSNC